MAATTVSPSSSSPRGDDDRHIPTALALPAATAVVATASCRFPPPCWSPNETTALIDAYRDKWYSLQCSNLRANHWYSLRRSNLRCAAPARPRRPPPVPSQDGEAPQAGMDAMEKGFGGDPSSSSSDGEEDEDDDGRRNTIKRINDLYNHDHKQKDYSQPLDQEDPK
ncbi:sequence-specific DNA binding transcription factors [Striga asiatica]|uniref:Sequence-specific DNA binding transcription factors n=1 Tax=Striga asiatica TaxID=4170 RepID=A0A5A7QBW2_STRAF|nr:sequence-specific DNA binding transcription factors [Striga asiatica]